MLRPLISLNHTKLISSSLMAIMAMSSGESSGANLTLQKVAMAFLQLQHKGRNNEEISKLLTSSFFSAAAAQEQQSLELDPLCSSDPSTALDSIANLAKLIHNHRLQMEASLKSLRGSSDQNSKMLRRINAGKDFVAASFAAAAAFSTGMATFYSVRGREDLATPAAAATLLFGTLGGWIHTRLDKREREEEKQGRIISLMTAAVETTIDDLSKIQSCVESISSSIDEGTAEQIMESLEALESSVREFLSGRSWATKTVFLAILFS